jgi:hypothetical protein
MSNFGEDARESTLKHLTKTAATEIIKKIKNWVTVEPTRASKRWPFELMQNALDATHGEDRNVSIELERRSDEGREKLIFRHDGGPFTYEEICGLIYGGSTKREVFVTQPEYIGRFGRGFLISHVLSRKVRLIGTGIDKDGLLHAIDICIERTSEIEDDIEKQIERCFDELDTNCPVIDEETARARWCAEYTYDLDTPQALRAAELGIQTLQSLTPWILAVNSKLTEVKLPGTSFARQPKNDKKNPDRVTILENGSKTPFDILLCGSTSLSVGIQIEGNNIAQLPEDLPRLFISMPLIGSESVPLPFVISSPRLEPAEERDILVLAEGAEAISNKNVLEEALNSFYQLTQYCVNNGQGNLHHLCSFSPVSDDSLKNKPDYWGFWQTSIKKSVNILANQPFVNTGEGYKTPSEVSLPTPIIVDPLVPQALDLNQYGLFFDIIHDLFKPLPVKEIAYDWQNTLRRWKHIDPDLSLDLISVQDLHDTITSKSLLDGTFQSVDSVADSFGVDVDIMERVFIRTYELLDGLFEKKIIKEDFIDGLLLNQNRIVLKKAHQITDVMSQKVSCEVRIEDEPDGIPNALKDISQDIAFSLRTLLLDIRLSKYAIAQAFLKSRINTEQALDIFMEAKYKPQAKSKVDLEKSNHVAWAKLLIWCSLNKRLRDGFPVFSKDGQVAIWNRNDSNSLLILPFARIGLKEEFEKLIPESRVLNTKYFTLVAADQTDLLQNRLIEDGMCAGDVVTNTPTCKITRDKLKSILAKDEPLPKGKEHELTLGNVLMSSIQFYGPIIGSVSQVTERARLFFKFLLEVVCQRDTAWRTENTVICSCGTPHRIVPAEWLANIKCDNWVPVEKDEGIVQREANKDVIDSLLGAEGIRGAVLSQYGVDFLEHLGYERLDLSIKRRAYKPGVGNDERQIKAALSRVVDISPDVTLLVEELEVRRSREKIANDNQMIGKLVENIIIKILRNKKLKKIDITGTGSDIAVWPEPLEGLDVGTISLPPYEVEIKFTSGIRARLSVRQGEEAKIKGSKFFVLVVGGDSKLKDILLNEYPNYTTWQERQPIIDAIEQRTRLVGELHSKLVDSPVPDEIEADIGGYWVKNALWSQGKTIDEWIHANISKVV